MKCLILFAIIFKWILKITSLPKLYIAKYSKTDLSARNFKIKLIQQQFGRLQNKRFKI